MALTDTRPLLKPQAQMTPDEQVAFAWKYREHFDECRAHNIQLSIDRRRGYRMDDSFRNPWEELCAAVST